MKKKKIVLTYCFEKETEETYQSDLVGFAENRKIDDEEDVYEEYDFVEKKINKVDASWVDETSPIEISKMKEIITEAEKTGATHLNIFYHTDHQNYVINGLTVSK